MKKRVAGLCLMLTLCLLFPWSISAHAEEDDEGELYVYDDPNEVVTDKDLLPDDLDSSLDYVSVYDEREDEIIYEKNYDKNVKDDSFSIDLKHDTKYVIEVGGTNGGVRTDSFKTPSKVEVLPTLKPSNGVSDKKAPVISFSSLPDTAYLGESVKITVKTNEVCDITFNGETKENTKKATFSIHANAVFTATATDKSGNKSQKSLKVNIFKSAIASQVKQSRYAFSSNGNKPISSNEIIHTGSASYITLISISIGLIALGVFLFTLGKRKKGGSSNANKA